MIIFKRFSGGKTAVQNEYFTFFRSLNPKKIKELQNFENFGYFKVEKSKKRQISRKRLELEEILQESRNIQNDFLTQ